MYRAGRGEWGDRVREWNLRVARTDDAAALAEIYAPFVRGSAVTFEYDAPDAQAFAERIADTLRQYPYLVLTRHGAAVGYAYAHRVRERAAFDWAAEPSVYLAPEAQGRGAGGVLYACLTELLERQHLRALYACITLPNESSLRLHRRLGYREAGVWHAAGWKHGAWHDVAWLEKPLGGAGAPQAVVPFPALGRDEIQECLQRHQEMLNHGGR